LKSCVAAAFAGTVRDYKRGKRRTPAGTEHLLGWLRDRKLNSDLTDIIDAIERAGSGHRT